MGTRDMDPNGGDGGNYRETSAGFASWGLRRAIKVMYLTGKQNYVQSRGKENVR